MTNELSFGQRNLASWRTLIEWLNKWLARVDPEREAYRDALRLLGQRMLHPRHQDAVLRESALALIAACIEVGITDRDTIIRTVRRHHVISGHFIGVLLTRHTGSDPNQHLWSCDPSWRYRLLR